MTASGRPGHHLANLDVTPADNAEQQVLPSAGIILIASPLGVSLGTVKRQDAPAFTEDRYLQDGIAVSAASPAVLEHLKQGTALLLLQSRIYMCVGILLKQAGTHCYWVSHCVCSHAPSNLFTHFPQCFRM